MTLQPVQMIGSAITPVTLGASTSATPASSSSGTVGSAAGSGLNFLGTSPAASTASSAAPATATSGASGVSDAGLAVSAGKLGGSLTGSSTLSTAAGLAGNALAIYNGVKQGGVAGYGGAALAGVTAANKIDSLATGSGFLSSGAAAGVGAAGNLLGIYSGIKQGGVMGYGSAALNAVQLYNNVNTVVNAYEGGAASTAAAAGSTAAAADTATAADTAAAAGSTAASAIPVVGAAIALGTDVATANRFGNEGLTLSGKLAPGQSMTTTPTGGAELLQGNLGEGLGMNTNLGEGTYFQDVGGKQTSLGATTSGQLRTLGDELLANPTQAGQLTYDKTVTPAQMQAAMTGLGSSQQQLEGNAFGIGSSAAGNAPNQMANISTMASDLYNSTGGAKGWGTSFAGFTTDLEDILKNTKQASSPGVGI